MSKRLIFEEWSDDDIEDNEVLERKRRRQTFINNNNIEVLDKSSKSGNNLVERFCNQLSSGLTKSIYNQISTGLTNIMSYKIFKAKSKPNQNQMYEIVRPESQTPQRIGMNSIDRNSIAFTNSPSDTNLSLNTTNHQNNYKIVNYPINYNVMIVNQQIPLQQMPIQSVISLIPTQPTYTCISSNNNPNPLVLCQNNVNMEQMKCQICGQIASSPGKCGHCGRNKAVQNQRRTSSASIPSNQFYKTSENELINRSTPTCRPSLSSVFSPPLNHKQHNTLSQKINTIQKLNSNPECIVLDDGDSQRQNTNHRIDGSLNTVNNECIEISDISTEKAFNEFGMQCDMNCVETETNETRDESDGQKVETNKREAESTANLISNSEEEIKSLPVLNATAFPEYIMFGTYRTEAKTLDFSSDGIKLTNVSPNKMETKFKYHIMIPFVEMKELYYCTDASLPILFIKPTKESNDKIQECMYLGKDSRNGLKFDIDSQDFREQNIITVLKEKLSEKFISILTKSSTNCNPKITCKALHLEKAKLLLNRVQNRSTNGVSSERRFEQSISQNPKINSIRSAQNPFAVNANRPKMHFNRGIHLTHSTDKKSMINKRSFQCTPNVIELDDDDDEDNDSKDKKDEEFDKVILTYPKDEKNAIQLTGNDIICLNRGEFLNDNIVNFYLRHYFRSEKIKDEIRERTHIFDTLFFIQLTEKLPSKRKNSGEEPYTFEQRYYQKLKSWTKSVDIFAKDFLILPIIKESHWFLAIVCNAHNVSLVNNNEKTNNSKSLEETNENQIEKRSCIIFMDSLGNASYKKSLSSYIRDFLSFEWKEKKHSDISFKPKAVMKDFFPKVPNQTNSSDCGLFVLEFVEQFLLKPDYLLKKVFNNKTPLIDWFPTAEAKNKRPLIRTLILSLIPEEVANKLVVLIKDDNKESDDELKDEIGMELDLKDNDRDFVPDSIEELSSDD